MMKTNAGSKSCQLQFWPQTIKNTKSEAYKQHDNLLCVSHTRQQRAFGVYRPSRGRRQRQTFISAAQY